MKNTVGIIELIRENWEWLYAAIGAAGTAIIGWFTKGKYEARKAAKANKFDELEMVQNRMNKLNETLHQLFEGQLKDRKEIQAQRLRIATLESALKEIEQNCASECVKNVINKLKESA